MNQNRILSALQRNHPKLAPRLTQIDFLPRQILVRSGEPIEQVIFPASGLLCTSIDLNDEYVEAGLIGSSGLVGGGVAFGAHEHSRFIVGRFPGSANLLPAHLLAEIARADASVRAMLFAVESWVLFQAQQLAACNVSHSLSQRFTGWLLRAADLAGTTELPITQEMIAEALGVQRATVSNTASELQKKGVIRYRRGQISISDCAALAQEACDCHKRLQAYRTALFADVP
jgi:CRP-like cAMP-binding protein